MMATKRGDVLVIGVFALIGAALGAFCFMVYSDGPNAAVDVAVFRGSTQYKLDASLTVRFFGWEAYSRTAEDPSAFDVEVKLWTWGTPLALFVGGGAVSGFVGWLVSRWAQQRVALAKRRSS
jgi:uncharacterized membrane protein YfcA